MEGTPAQNPCFFELTDEQAASGRQPLAAGPRVVVQSFQEEPKDFPPSILLAKRSALADDCCVCLGTTMSGPVAVGQNQTELESENEFFVVSNKDNWLVKFHKRLEAGDKTDRNDKTDNDSKVHADQEQDSDAHDEEGVGEVALWIC